ncbi:MAG: 23S rRNA (pseudouridine(1915)-N(3))-methyltransferase RlmH [Pseudomonadota bacterium]
MRVYVCAVGRLKTGPERSLVDDYLKRFDRTGRALGLGPHALHEIDERKASHMAGEADLLEKAIPAGAIRVVLDERGKLMSSVELAGGLARWRDDGCADVAFVIGGADGLDPAFRSRADVALSFGKMVWPHMLARVMLSEQLYRATTILAGTPYHRI